MTGSRSAALLVGAALLLAGCGLTIPTDPDGTLDRVRSAEILRVGASPRPGWVDLDEGSPTGREPRLATAFAADLGAAVEWTVAG